MNKIAPSAGQKLPPLAPGTFRVVTKGIGIEKSDSEDGLPRRRFKTVMSSTIKDRRGDEIKPPALVKMRDQFREGRTIFMDHAHNVEDAFGTSDYAEIQKTGLIDDETGQPIYDLIVAGTVNEPNKRSSALADSLEGGYVKFGASIGVQVTKHKRNEAGAMDIWDVDTLEGSIVGIPMNQRSWVQKALDAIETLDDDNESEFFDETKEETMPPKTAALDTTEGEALQVQGLDSEKDAKCPDCGHGADCDCATCDCSGSYHNQKSISDDLTLKSEGVAEEGETAPGGQGSS